MRTCVVDTNVAISANGRNTHADPDCQRACVKELLEACRDRVIAIDDLGLIFDEYKQNLRFAGAPGVGDMFFKHVYNHQYNAMRVSRVSVTPCDNDNQGFEETPYQRTGPSTPSGFASPTGRSLRFRPSLNTPKNWRSP